MTGLIPSDKPSGLRTGSRPDDDRASVSRRVSRPIRSAALLARATGCFLVPNLPSAIDAVTADIGSAAGLDQSVLLGVDERDRSAQHNRLQQHARVDLVIDRARNRAADVG